MDINDIMAKPTGIERPDHPDFWRLSEIILELKAEQQEAGNDHKKAERLWKAHYEKIGDFDSIAYSAIQAALQIHNIKTGMDWAVHMSDPARHRAYVGTVQAFFDGFVMGAEFVRRGGHQEAPNG